MGNYTKLDILSISKLNNAEYAFYMERLDTLLLEATLVKLNIPEALHNGFKDNLKLICDVVAQSRISDETVLIAKLESEVIKLVVYLLGHFRTEKSSPIPEIQEAATSLYNYTHTYLKLQTLPLGQMIQKVRGLTADLAKPDAAAAVEVLGRTNVVTQIAELNERLADLVNKRAAKQIAAHLVAGKAVREKMNIQYDDITTIASATVVLHPCDEVNAFAVAFNKLSADTRTAYHQRLAQTDTKKPKDEE